MKKIGSALQVIKDQSLALATLLALCTGSVFAQAAEENIVPNPKAGAQIYKGVCSGCHTVSIAPTLRGIIDRPIASVTAFAGYTDALKAKQSMTWTKENLDLFLTAPTEFAPGTLMVQTLPDPQQRADIIAFLASLPPPRK